LAIPKAQAAAAPPTIAICKAEKKGRGVPKIFAFTNPKMNKARIVATEEIVRANMVSWINMYGIRGINPPN
jgi:hypothetical protein